MHHTHTPNPMRPQLRPTATIGILAALTITTALTFGQQQPPDAPRDAAGHEAAPTHFLEVPSADSTIGIYRGTRNPDIFLAFPACLLAADPTADSPTPIPLVRQNGRDVELQLVNASTSIREAQLSAINNRLRQMNQPEISVDRISLLNLTYLSFAVTNDDLAAHVEPYFLPADNKPTNIRLDGMQSIRLRCNSDEIAQKLVSMLRDPDEIVRFRIRIIAHGSRYEGVEVEITGQQLAQTAAFNSIIPTADTTIPVAVSQEQMAQITRNALRELNVSVVADLTMAAQALAPADLMALIDRFQRQISEDFRVTLDRAEEMTQTYIDGESFAPDRIRREASKISEALTHAASSAIDTFEERIRNGDQFNSNEDIRNALHHAVNSTDVGVDTKVGVSWGFGVGAVNVDNNVRVNASRNVLDNVRNEARQAGFTRFSDETRDALHRAMTNYFNRVSNVESEWDGEKIIPKTLKLRRIVRENLRTAGRLYFANRTRIVSSDTYEWNRTDEPRYLTVAEPAKLVELQRELHDYRHRYQFEIDRLAQNHAAAMAAMQQTHEATIAAMQRRMAELTAAHEMNADDTQRELKATVGEWQQRHDALRDEWQQRHQAELANLQREHETAIAALQQAHETAIAALQQAHETAIAAMQQEHETAIAAMRREQGTVSRAELDAATSEAQAAIAALQQAHETAIAAMERERERERAIAAYTALPKSGSRQAQLQAREAFLRQYPNASQVSAVRREIEQLRASLQSAPEVAGYTWLREETFSAGGQSHTMQVYRCDKFAQLVNARTETRGGKQYCDVDCEFVLIPAGEFMMGSPASESGRSEAEGPQRRVRIARPFLMARTEVSQRVWQAVMGSNPSYFKNGANGAPSDSSRLPVENVSWDDIVGSNGFNARAGVRGLRLPSEAEWEYACRAGTTTPFSFGATITPGQVNYDGNYPYGNAARGEYRSKPVAVGSLPANAFGLHEIHGNVWEWCQDDWADNYAGAPTDGTARRVTGASDRVFRGGSWDSFAVRCRSAYRHGDSPGWRISRLGFRPVQALLD